MKICVDIQSAITQRAGIGRYTKQLVDHLSEVLNEDELALFYFDFKRQGLPFPAPHATQNVSRLMPGRLAQKLWKTLHFPPYEWFAGKADVLHFPNFIIPPCSNSSKTVVSVHDMSYERFPQHTEALNLKYLRAEMARTFERSDAILTISQFSADEIAALTTVDPSRIFPIHLGITDTFTPPAAEARSATRSQLGLDRPYLAMVSTLEPRKNFDFLIEVYERMTDYDGDLVIAGMKGWKYDTILDRVKRSPRAANIRYIDYIDDKHLPSLYAEADLFLFPSHYEGFGFTPLEAMACGAAVVSSPGGSLREVLRDGACVEEIDDADRWSTACLRLLSDTTERNALIERGKKVAATYRWEETARKTMDVYRQVGA